MYNLLSAFIAIAILNSVFANENDLWEQSYQQYQRKAADAQNIEREFQMDLLFYNDELGQEIVDLLPPENYIITVLPTNNLKLFQQTKWYEIK